MNNQSIIKWRFLWVSFWAVGVLYLVFYIGEDQFFGTHYTAWVFGLFVLISGIYYFLKTGMVQFLLIGIIIGTGYWHYEAAAHLDTPFTMLTFYIHLIGLIFLMIFVQSSVNKAIRLELHARRLFKLAAESVEGVQDGFTDRPYSAGKMTYTMTDITGLARFMSGKDIIRYQINQDSVIFAFSMNTSPLVDKSFTRVSTITFDSQGHISVKISRKDYNQYRRKLSFDQLCESFARLFGHFAEAYKNNNENRIVHELKSV